VWFFVAVPQFGQLIVSLVAAVIAPGGASAADQLNALTTQQFLLRLLPSTLYREASVVLLNPSVTAVTTPATLDQYEQYQQQIGSLLSLDQSVLLAWPHFVVLFGLTIGCFALAYVRFMRQEVRACAPVPGARRCPCAPDSRTLRCTAPVTPRLAITPASCARAAGGSP
jgi:ABC-2 type transport system permease protein